MATKLTIRYFFILMLAIGSCVKKADDTGGNETTQDSLALFPQGSWIKFVGTNMNDQIALLFKRDTTNTFKYRIELLRKWKGLPLDYGVLKLEKIEADSIYVFQGGNSHCEVVIKIYDTKGKFGRDYAKLERNCKDDSLDITIDEFQRLLYK